MSIEGQRDPIPTGVYNGFSAPMRNLRRRTETRAGRILMGGLAAAGVLGVAFGLAAKPDVRSADGLDLRPDEIVQIEVGPGRAQTPSASVVAAPLQTLPQGVQAPVVVVARAPAAPTARAAPAAATETSTLDEQHAELTGADCREAATPAERLACAGERPAAGDLKIDRPSDKRAPRVAEVAANEAFDEPADLVVPPPGFADE